MTTIFIDAQLEASDASFVVGAGTYTVDDLPTKSELDGEFFVFPAGLVVAGGKEVWDYPTVVPIDDYAALGPRETPPDTLATPWPEDEMVSADMHFNLGMHVQQLALIAEDHERRIRELEMKLEMLLELIKKLFGLLGGALGGLLGGNSDVDCNTEPSIKMYVRSDRDADMGLTPNSHVINTWCAGFEENRHRALMGTGHSGGMMFKLNETNSIAYTTNKSPMAYDPNGIGQYYSEISTEDKPPCPAWTATILSSKAWFSIEPGGDPLEFPDHPVAKEPVFSGLWGQKYQALISDNDQLWNHLDRYVSGGDRFPLNSDLGLAQSMMRMDPRVSNIYYLNILRTGFNPCGNISGMTVRGNWTDVRVEGQPGFQSKRLGDTLEYYSPWQLNSKNQEINC